MNEQPRLLHLSDAQWAQIEAAFPQRRGTSGFERKISNRTAFEVVLYRERTGCPWRDLPVAYGDDHTIYMRWQRWVKSGVPQRAMITWYVEAAKRGELDLSLALIDSTVVRAHQHAAGARKKRAIKPWDAVAGG
jgi:transposase